jgi:hypothetical protein
LWALAGLALLAAISLATHLVIIGYAVLGEPTKTVTPDGHYPGNVAVHGAPVPLSATGQTPSSYTDEASSAPPELQTNATGGFDGDSVAPRPKPPGKEILRALLSALENAKGAQLAELIKKLWLVAADNGVPEEVLVALDRAARNSDPNIAQLAELALQDLRDQKTRELERASTVVVAAEEIAPAENGKESNGATRASGRSGNAVAAVEQNARTSLQSPEPAVRLGAARTLGNYRTENAMELLSTAAIDVDPSVRYAALESLWRNTADRTTLDWENARSIMQRAIGDPDSDVARLAQGALTDLSSIAAGRTANMPGDQTSIAQRAQSSGSRKVNPGTE